MTDERAPQQRNDGPAVTSETRSGIELGEQMTEPETDQPPVEHPKLFIGSIADKTSINDHGIWLDATIDVDDMQAAIRDMLLSSPVLQAAEKADGTGAWGIHDHRGFGVFELYEDDELEVVRELALGIHQHDEAFAAWAELNHGDRSRWAEFSTAYLGTFNGLRDYGEHVITEAGWMDAVEAALPEAVSRHAQINGAALAQDMWLNDEILIAHKPGGGEWVFRGEM